MYDFSFPPMNSALFLWGKKNKEIKSINERELREENKEVEAVKI